MPLEEPSWWYDPAGRSSARARLLAPLGDLAGHLAVRRYQRTSPYRSRLPVICVGNFTAGGTGKTPLSLHIAEHLKSAGESPVYLTRGYGGTRPGPVWLDAARDTARDVGDEPLLLARQASVMISRDRRKGALAIEQGARSASVIVMDDGLQNPALAKDLTLAVVDGVRGLGNGRVIPAGPLRAPLDFQLGLIDGIVVNGGGEAPAVLEELKRYFHGPVLHASAVAAGETRWIEDRPLVAFAGIANPVRFFSLVERLGGRISERIVFADHHAFSEADAKRILRRASAHGAALVTTEKDWVRLTGSGGARLALREAARTLPIRLTFDAAQTSRLASLLDGALSRVRKAG